MKRKIIPIIVSSATMAISGQSFAEINMNGFATIGAGQTITEDKSYSGYDNNFRFDSGSHFGMQFSADLADGVSATTQFIARGEDDWVVEAEWAYLSYEINDNAKLIVGKQRSPFYMYSDFVDVGYAYHWVTPPDGVYSLPFDSTNAAAVVINNYFGDLESTVQLMFGRNQKEINFNGPTELDSYNTFTLNWTGTYDFASFRVGISKGKLDIPIEALNDLTNPWEDISQTVYDYTYDGAIEAGATVGQATGAATQAQTAVAGVDGQKVSDGIKIDEDDVMFAGVGVTLDFDSYFVVAEITQLDIGDSLVGTNTSSYLGAGYRMNDFTFHATYGMDEDKTNESIFDGIDQATIDGVAALSGLVDATEATLAESNAKSHYITVGTRWDFHPSTAIKFDVTQFVDDDADDDAETLLYRLAITNVF